MTDDCRLISRRVTFVLLACLAWAPAFARAPVAYHVSFPEPQHHWMQVEVRFADVPPGPLSVLMSRASPGRYAVHEFVKNVYDVQIDNGAGGALKVDRPNPSEWDVTGHRGAVRVRYRVYGDRTDGTFLAIDPTHAHINIPAALMWARGLESRSVRVTFEAPVGAAWKVATQLHPTDDPRTFTAANLQHFVDSQAKVGNFVLRTFQVEQSLQSSAKETFRIALHHDGSDLEADPLAADFERIVREEAAVFGELPAYEGGLYTFLADYLPYASRDGMEHRNSAVMTSAGALNVAEEREDIIRTAAHEFFHCWSVERIRPRSLEPFNLEEANMSGELWLAEGFASYYEAVILRRTGLVDLAQTAETFGRDLDRVIRSPARKYRSAEDMSRMAPFVNAAVFGDRTDFENTHISYYTWGAAIGLALDLSLRERSGGKVTLDDYMRALWRDFGKPGGPAEGLVGRPYTRQDLRDALAKVSGGRAFASEFFDRYIQGREVADYETLLGRAGMLLRKRYPQRAWIGPVRLSVDRGRARIAFPTIEDTPAHAAGLDQDDEIVSFDGESIGTPAGLDDILRRHAPGDELLVEDPAKRSNADTEGNRDGRPTPRARPDGNQPPPHAVRTQHARRLAATGAVNRQTAPYTASTS
ncbi:MAG: M61 family peptidase [Acidobacteria bacterium]|nr:M61 family peptidase [Acidobacteriota bacterium]